MYGEKLINNELSDRFTGIFNAHTQVYAEGTNPQPFQLTEGTWEITEWPTAAHSIVLSMLNISDDNPPDTVSFFTYSRIEDEDGREVDSGGEYIEFTSGADILSTIRRTPSGQFELRNGGEIGGKFLPAIDLEVETCLDLVESLESKKKLTAFAIGGLFVKASGVKIIEVAPAADDTTLPVVVVEEVKLVPVVGTAKATSSETVPTGGDEFDEYVEVLGRFDDLIADHSEGDDIYDEIKPGGSVRTGRWNLDNKKGTLHSLPINVPKGKLKLVMVIKSAEDFSRVSTMTFFNSRNKLVLEITGLLEEGFKIVDSETYADRDNDISVAYKEMDVLIDEIEQLINEGEMVTEGTAADPADAVAEAADRDEDELHGMSRVFFIDKPTRRK